MKCSFCAGTIPSGTGKQYVKKDGTILFFCSRKCEKNMLQLKRKAYTTRWTNSFYEEKKTTKTK